MNTMDKIREVASLSGFFLFTILLVLLILANCQTPNPPVSPIPTPVAQAAVEQQALTVSDIITGEIVILWQNENLGIYPQQITSSGDVTATLYIDFELRLEDGGVITQTINTGLNAPETSGTGQFNGNIPYQWQDVPAGTHAEYSRLRWEIESSDVVVVQHDEYVPYRETVYGVTVTDGQLVEADANHFAFYRTVEVRQYYYRYLPMILSDAGN